MAKQQVRAAMRMVLPGLVAGGLCGAAVGFRMVPPVVGIVGAALCGLFVGLGGWRIRHVLRGSDRENTQ